MINKLQRIESTNYITWFTNIISQFNDNILIILKLLTSKID